jgi:hypothetical protein
MTFPPAELAEQIRRYLPAFTISYQPDARQAIAGNWPASINGHQSAVDWGWKHQYDLQEMVADMLWHLGDAQIKATVERLRPAQRSQLSEHEATHVL